MSLFVCLFVWLVGWLVGWLVAGWMVLCVWLASCNTHEEKYKHTGELNVSAWEGNPLA